MKQLLNFFCALGLVGCAVTTLTAKSIEPTPAAPAKLNVLLPAARDVNSQWGLPLRKLFDEPMRDPYVMKAPDGYYYLTGTTEPVDRRVSMWEQNDGIPLWRSKDLVQWENLGFVWTFKKDATWQKGATDPKTGKFLQSIWAPEIHFLKGNFYLCYSVNFRDAKGDYVGIGILRSTTGKAEGPYVDVSPDGPIVPDIDAHLFEDDDGKVYLIRAGYYIARLKDDLSGLAEPERPIKRQGKSEWNEGEFMLKVGGKYVLLNAAVSNLLDPKWDKTYDVRVATADNIYGPYTPTVRGIPHAGHNSLFQGPDGRWWSTAFGTDSFTPDGIRPYILPVTVSEDGAIRADYVSTPAEWRWTTKAPSDDRWTSVNFDDSAWARGKSGFGDKKVEEHGPVRFVNTPTDQSELWLRTAFSVQKSVGRPSLYVMHSGPAKVWINGKLAASLEGAAANYKTIPVDPSATLNDGLNTIAVQATLASPNAYFDVGIVASPR